MGILRSYVISVVQASMVYQFHNICHLYQLGHVSRTEKILTFTLQVPPISIAICIVEELLAAAAEVAVVVAIAVLVMTILILMLPMFILQ